MQEINFRQACKGDNDQLVSLTAAAEMAGETSWP